MKAMIGMVALLLMGSGMRVPAVYAQGHSPVENTARLRATRQNALDAAANAGIYQWKRVNREVDRIVADVDKLAAQSSPASASKSRELQEAVRELRSARLQRDVDRIGEATQKIVALCDALQAGK